MVLAIGKCLGIVSHESQTSGTTFSEGSGELDCDGSCKVRQHFELRNRQGRPLPAGQSSNWFQHFFPALAGFQSEHAIEIPFMLTMDGGG